MEMTISNFHKQKSINVELPDDFVDDINDIRIVIGPEQFKLQSTKSEKDKQREKAAIDFGEEAYPDLIKLYPNFGTDECPIDRNAMKQIIKDKLISYGDKYSALLSDDNMEQLLSGLVSAFANYCTVYRRMEEEDKIIEETKLDDNVFFDYIKRFKAAFVNASCISDVHDSIVKIHQYAGIDKREIFGYTFIFQCLSPFYDKIKEIETELSEMKPPTSIKDSAIFTDKEYWMDVPQREIVNTIVNNLDNLEKTYREFCDNSKNDTSDPFEFYGTEVCKNYSDMIEKHTKLVDYTNTIFKQHKSISELSNEENETLNEYVKDVNQTFKKILVNLSELRTKFNLDQRKWKAESQSTIINANFGLIDFCTQELNSANESAKPATFDKIIAQLKLHGQLINKAVAGKINTDDLVNGDYSTEELAKIASES